MVKTKACGVRLENKEMRMNRHMCNCIRKYWAGLIFIGISQTLGGDIIGTVTAPAVPAPASVKPLSPYARSRYYHNPAAASNEIRTGTSEPNTVVYLEADPRLKPAAPPLKRPTMNQRNLNITPHILPVVVGTTVDFPNSDNLYHNLFSLSPTRKFDLGRYAQGHSKSVTFDRTGEVRIFCDIHPNMSAVILVVPNHYYAIPDEDGEFSIPNIPPGRYRLHIWHEQLPELVREVEVPDSGSVMVQFNFVD